MSLPKRLKSAALVFSSLAGSPPAGSAPKVAILETTSGIFRISLRCVFSSFTVSGDMPLGPNRPCHADTSTSLTPSSARVGTLGASALRWLSATARAVTLPPM